MNLLTEPNVYQLNYNPFVIKIRFRMHDNIGSGPIFLPTIQLHTTDTWYAFDASTGKAYVI